MLSLKIEIWTHKTPDFCIVLPPLKMTTPHGLAVHVHGMLKVTPDLFIAEFFSDNLPDYMEPELHEVFSQLHGRHSREHAEDTCPSSVWPKFMALFDKNDARLLLQFQGHAVIFLPPDHGAVSFMHVEVAGWSWSTHFIADTSSKLQKLRWQNVVP